MTLTPAIMDVNCSARTCILKARQQVAQETTRQRRHDSHIQASAVRVFFYVGVLKHAFDLSQCWKNFHQEIATRFR
ncbi:hypothetical protein APZ00_15750 [Pannonibacter phragmitetus]|uniref:Uncharacterized protein n=1 Tax=Pannonibacter phragmitetus TaxID=121719 RepID=A0A0U3P6D2_9HYPH|nr:hypothetical protein APZ00_15750 [Pannonibacter phragmitetus]